MQNLACLAVTLHLLFSVSSDMHLATMKVEKSSASGKNYRLYIRGKKTKLIVETSGDPFSVPDVEVHKVNSGIIYGTIEITESGALTSTTFTAFIEDNGKFFSKEEFLAKAARGESVLLIPKQDIFVYMNARDALLYKRGRFLNIGSARDAGFGKDGTVEGWFYANKDGTPWSGQWNDRIDVFKQYFEYTNGARVLKGRVGTDSITSP